MAAMQTLTHGSNQQNQLHGPIINVPSRRFQITNLVTWSAGAQILSENVVNQSKHNHTVKTQDRTIKNIGIQHAHIQHN